MDHRNNQGLRAETRRRDAFCQTSIAIIFVTVGYLYLPQTLFADPVASFDDVAYWVGSGTNQSAIVVDWDDANGNDESLVWGFRWSDNATGEEMVRAIIMADTRLFAKLGSSNPMGTPLYGIGYDLSEDALFAISDNTIFDSNGLVETGVPDPPPSYSSATSVDPEDLYAEGWYTGHWHHGVGLGNPFDGGEWTDGPGMTDERELTDGCWDSWTFTHEIFPESAFAQNPIAAEPPPSLAADFEPDGDVDGDDLAIWKSGFGLMSASHAQGDADLDGDVDGNDFLLWQREFGAALGGDSAGASPSQASVPEPTARLLATLFILLYCVLSKFYTIKAGVAGQVTWLKANNE